MIYFTILKRTYISDKTITIFDIIKTKLINIKFGLYHVTHVKRFII